MKIRTGFVSNSSSSSYVCEICGDVGEDDDIVTCEREHTFCIYHLHHSLFSKEIVSAYVARSESLSEHDKQELIRLIRAVDPSTFNQLRGSLYSESSNPALHQIDVLLDDIDYNVERWEIRENLPPEYCPICNLEVITDSDLINYFTASTRMSRNDVIAAVKRRFNNYETFNNYLQENKVR